MSVQYIAGYDSEWIQVRPPWRLWPAIVAGTTAMVLAAMGYAVWVLSLPWPALVVLGGSALVLVRLVVVSVDQLIARTLELTPDGLRISGALATRTYAWSDVADVFVAEHRGRLSDPPPSRPSDIGLFVLVAGGGNRWPSEICLATLPADEQRSLEKIARRMASYAKRAVSAASVGDVASSNSAVR